MVALTDNVSCGVAGWSYPDWKGYVYPRGVKDTLRYLAEYVDVIEINSTFYRPPDARTCASWRQRTEDLSAFFFTAKLHQDVTHGGRLDPDMARAFHEGFKPLTDAGRLKHLLAQFRYDFADSAATRAYLENVCRSYGDVTNLTLELRHNSWQSPSAQEFLNGLGVSVANLDYPLSRTSFNLRCCAVGDHAYLRLHGRNTAAWFSKSAGRNETYNYLYSAEELEEICARAVEIGEMSASLTLIANNHFQGKEVVNALQLKSRLSGKKVDVPRQLLSHYPQLEPIRKNGG